VRIGLTGGIGSGKSTVATMLADKGAVIVDADRISRRIVEPGSPVLARLAEEFGADIVRDDGSLDRGMLAERAFATDRGTRHLNEITHPAIRELAEVELQRAADQAEVVVYEMPLLVETGQVSLVDAVVVVDVSMETQVERAMARGSTEADVRARMSRQASRERRLDAADHVIDNNGSRERTQEQVDALWIEWTGR
jgi:dephospho-CoA kinase